MSETQSTLARESSGFLRFCLVGGFGLIVDASTLVLLVQKFHADPYLARLASIAFAVSVTWAAHRLWTFRTVGGERLGEWLRYQLTSAFGAAVNFGLYSLLIASIAGLAPLWAMAISSIVALAVNFLGARFFAFSPDSFRPT
ncbi:MAG: GtrA family protein [Pseudomonadota bacterium]